MSVFLPAHLRFPGLWVFSVSSVAGNRDSRLRGNDKGPLPGAAVLHLLSFPRLRGDDISFGYHWLGPAGVTRARSATQR
jgi:hypothetical protein